MFGLGWVGWLVGWSVRLSRCVYANVGMWVVHVREGEREKSEQA
jgi:hypothetical protein